MKFLKTLKNTIMRNDRITISIDSKTKKMLDKQAKQNNTSVSSLVAKIVNPKNKVKSRKSYPRLTPEQWIKHDDAKKILLMLKQNKLYTEIKETLNVPMNRIQQTSDIAKKFGINHYLKNHENVNQKIDLFNNQNNESNIDIEKLKKLIVQQNDTINEQKRILKEILNER